MWRKAETVRESSTTFQLIFPQTTSHDEHEALEHELIYTSMIGGKTFHFH